MRDNIGMVKKKGLGHTFGMINQDMRVNGHKIRLKDMVNTRG